jgi:hypothetical protein
MTTKFEIKTLDEERCSRRCCFFNLDVKYSYCSLFGPLDRDRHDFLRHDGCYKVVEAVENRAHRAVYLTNPITGERILADFGLKSILPRLWEAGIDTKFSCFGHPDRAYLVVVDDGRMWSYFFKRDVVIEKATVKGCLGLYAKHDTYSSRDKFWKVVLSYAEYKKTKEGVST